MKSERKENLLEMHPSLSEASVEGSCALPVQFCLRDEGSSESSGMTTWGEETQTPTFLRSRQVLLHNNGSVPLFCKILIKQLLFIPLL